MKKVINARIIVKSEAIEQYLALAKTMVEKSNSEQGCLIYKLYQEVGKMANIRALWYNKLLDISFLFFFNRIFSKLYWINYNSR
jgi:hypothetical protein